MQAPFLRAIPALLAAAVLGPVAAVGQNGPSPAVSPASLSVPAIGAREFDCIMEPKVVVKLGTAVTGLISKVAVDRGDTVREGQVVAQLDSGVQEAIVALARMKATNEFQILSHQSRKEFLTRKLERIRTLQKKDFASVAALDEVIADLKVSENAEREAQLGLKLATLDLERETQVLAQRQIKSPIDGIVTERALFTGEYRNETNFLMTIAQIDPLNVEVILPVAHYGQLKIGSVGVVKPEQPVGGTYSAKVVIIDQVLDAGSGTFGARLELKNTGNKLPAGIRCKVAFEQP